MNNFTIKDFISNITPCVSCDNVCNVYLLIIDFKTKKINRIKPTIEDEYINFDLKITYSNKLQLKVELKSNKFFTNNLNLLKKYFDESEIYLDIICKKCSSKAKSTQIKLDFKNKFIKPISIEKETIFFLQDSNLYTVHSDYVNKKTLILIDEIKDSYKISKDKFIIPLINRKKTRSKFIDKIKTCIVFS
jgi:hypothetical protein